MQIVYDPLSLQEYFVKAARVSEERPVLIDRFLEDAFESTSTRSATAPAS